ncbi:MAG: SCO family protein, partial [Actinomycetota bacterium]|nr:SCO family protein [Actinomycetota bacterium]
ANGQGSTGQGSTGQGSTGQAAQARAAADNPNLDTGTSIGGTRAPDFRLTNQFGQPVSLSAFRGKVVILAFTDSECTTICPLTTASMVAAKDLLGKAGDQVQLLGIDANPEATSRSKVMAYSQSHGMVNQWDFQTGSLAQLRANWKAYHVYVQIEQGQIDHTPALYVIDTHGRERRLYLTTMAYTTIGQAGQLLAQEASSLLPGHPKLASQQSLGQIADITPATAATVPAVGGPGTTSAGTTGGTIALGPGRARMAVFFASWLSETSDLAGQLTGLNAYARAAAGGRLPGLVALDEAVTEPSAATIRSALAQLRTPLQYPVGLDTTGRVADGYGVQDQPWFELVSATGKILWSHDGWLPVPALEAAARKA